jgi:hypothetical protein
MFSFRALGGVAAVLCAGCGSSSSQTLPKTPFYFIGAGDIAQCGAEAPQNTAAEQTAKLIRANPEATVYTLGDNVYDSGTETEFSNCYAPTWGTFLDRTYPCPGNHDYGTPDAAGYFGYYGGRAGGGRKGYYSYDVGTWHMVSLNSNVDAQTGSEQDRWLRLDLQAHKSSRCVLAYWHHPVFSSSAGHGNDPKMADLWKTLFEHGADVVLSGHDHGYERFARQRHDGTADPLGPREFVVGTGGAGMYGFLPPRPNSEVRIESAFGVLRFALWEDSYDWLFIPVDPAARLDSGHGVCQKKP